MVRRFGSVSPLTDVSRSNLISHTSNLEGLDMNSVRCLALAATLTLLACTKKAPESAAPPDAAPAPAAAPAPSPPPAAGAPAAAPGAEPAPGSPDDLDKKLARAQKIVAKVQKGLT